MIANDLPTGTVTFLFTDIEGSTRLLHELGDRYGEVLAQHHLLMRRAFSRHRGVEVSTDGDAFFVVFPSVPDAINAAIEVQHELYRQAASEPIPVAVRMGLHTGDAELIGDNYGGLDVHRAARISSAAHGGQVLLSAVTAQHAMRSPKVSRGARVKELGRFRLKDLDEPEQLFQLCIDGLPSDFPAPQGLGSTVHLPPQLDQFVERRREVAELRSLLSRHRLVTLTGPGGTGKTRLATEVAAIVSGDFPDGVFFVPLASIAEPDLVPSTIAGTLSLREAGTRPVLETVKDYLGNKTTLLLLDNFEQVVSSAPVVSEMLRAATELKVMVTSRAPLNITGEQEYPVPPMSVPDPQRTRDAATLRGYEAVDLFVERARAVAPDFDLTPENAPLIAEICARLDGLPLAIELAAARLRLLPPRELLARLDRSLNVLSSKARDVPQRQRTLMDAIDWSYRLLEADHQLLFRRLAIFRGGWTLEAAEAVCDPDGELGPEILDAVDTLVTNSLVRAVHEDGGLPRFVMLRTIAEYAFQALSESADLKSVGAKHASYFMAMAREAAPDIFNPDEDWPDRLEREHDNLRAVLGFFIDGRRTRDALELGACLWRFWQIRSHLSEGLMWLNECLLLPYSDDDLGARAAALTAAGGLTYWQNDFDTTRVHYEHALEAYRSIDDRRGVAEALYNVGFLALIGGEPRRARDLHEQSLAIYADLNDGLQMAFARWGIAMAHLEEGEFEAARTLALSILDVFEAHRNWFGRSLAEFVLIQVDRLSGNHERARGLLLETLERPESLKDVSTLSSLLDLLADVEIALERPRRGLKLASASSSLRKDYGGGAPPPLLSLDDPRALASRSLDAQEADEIWSQGAGMSIEEVAAYARKDPAGDE